MPDSLYRQAVAAAKAGERKQARTLLRDFLVETPNHEMAWIWLSEVSDDVDVRVYALEKAIAINPARTAVQKKLDKLEEEIAKQEGERLKPLAEAVALAGDGRFAKAQRILINFTNQHSQNEQAWLLLSVLVDNIEDKVVALENAQTINPYNNNTTKLLKQRQNKAEVDQLTVGRAAEKREDFPTALHAYGLASTLSTLEYEREIAQKRIAALDEIFNPRKKTETSHSTIRLPIGPVIFYILLLVIHYGLSFRQIPFISYLGIGVVFLGGLIRFLSLHMPDHPIWQQISLPAPVKQSVIPLAGGFIVVLPFLFLLIDALDRLSLS